MHLHFGTCVNVRLSMSLQWNRKHPSAPVTVQRIPSCATWYLSSEAMEHYVRRSCDVPRAREVFEPKSLKCVFFFLPCDRVLTGG